MQKYLLVLWKMDNNFSFFNFELIKFWFSFVFVFKSRFPLLGALWTLILLLPPLNLQFFLHFSRILMYFTCAAASSDAKYFVHQSLFSSSWSSSIIFSTLFFRCFEAFRSNDFVSVFNSYKFTRYKMVLDRGLINGGEIDFFHVVQSQEKQKIFDNLKYIHNFKKKKKN